MGERFFAVVWCLTTLFLTQITFAADHDHSEHAHHSAHKGHYHEDRALNASHKGHDHAQHSDQTVENTSSPESSGLKEFTLDQKSLFKNLSQSRSRDGSGGLVELPSADGEWIAFQVQERSNFAPGLAKKYPNIKSYRGYSVDQPWLRLHLSTSASGIAAAYTDVRSKVQTTIERVSKKDQRYVVYTNLHDRGDHPALECSTPDPVETKTDLISRSMVNLTGEMSPLVKFSDESTLTTYRLAVATNGQYTAYHGGTVESALSAINETLTALNVIFETDIGIRLELIENNDLVIYTDATTDPFQDDPSNLNGTMNAELQQTLDSVIGTENYDVGHVYSGIGGGGNAGAIGAFCDDTVKGSAWSASTAPEGSYFINLVAHEMGHQLGANHTFSMRSEGTGVNVEPGSGTTIMSYAGITGPDDVSNFGEDYYHNVSIIQGLNYLRSQSCDVTTAISNSVPTVEPVGDYSIPVGTPFVLTGVASDVNSEDVLTYTWEQVDSGIVTSSVFGPENTQGANFRSLFPSSSPTRYFPRLESVIAGELTLTNPDVSTTWETLSTIPREYNFALTVRDNAPGGGGVAYTNTKITAVDNGGAFAVTSQADGQVYLTGSEQTVTWRVAGTDIEPISVGFVSISMSDDGGLTYPYVLAETTVNDGSHSIILPDVVSENVRIKVQAIDNVFYAVSSENVTLTRDEIVLAYTKLDYEICANGTANADFTYQTSPEFTDTAIFSSPNVPSGLTIDYQPTSASANDTEVSATISASNDIALDSYILEILAQSDERDQSIFINLTVYNDDYSPVALIFPQDGILIDGLMTELQWQGQINAASYFVELATDENFTQIVEAVTTDSTSISIMDLQKDTTYYWRVTPVNNCGTADAEAPYSFTTFNLYQAQDLPLLIRSDVPTSITSTLSISEDSVISDINVGVEIDHTYVAELIVTLSSPNGTSVTLLQDGCYEPNVYPIPGIDVVFDDDSSELDCGTSNPVIRGNVKPKPDLLGAFNNQSTTGDWVLSITDIYSGDGGSLDNFTLEISTDGAFVNQAPIAFSQSMNLTTQSSELVRLIAKDPDGDTLTYTLANDVTSGDLTAPQPISLSSIVVDDVVRDGVVDENYIYLAAGEAGIAIVDVSDASSPVTTTMFDTSGVVNGIAIYDDRVFIANGPAGLQVIDVTDPSVPVLMGRLENGSSISTVAMSPDGTKAFIADDNNELLIVSVTNPNSLETLASLDVDQVLDIEVSADGNLLYLATIRGLSIVDIADLSNILTLGTFDSDFPIVSSALSDDGLMFVTDGSDLLTILNVTTSSQPTLIGSFELDGSLIDLAVSKSNDMLYAARGSSGISVISIENINNLQTIASFETSAYAIVLGEQETELYVADDAGGLEVVDVEEKVFNSGDDVPEILIYTKVSAQSQLDKFTFTVNDGELDSNEATVSFYDNVILNDGIFTYQTNLNGDLIITGCNADCPIDLVIPEIIAGNTVVAIADSAFATSNIRSLTLSDTITEIGDYAFALNYIESVTFGSVINRIGKSAFAYNNLVAISFLGDRPSIQADGFFGNRRLTYISYCEETASWPGAGLLVGSSATVPQPGCNAVVDSDTAISKFFAAADSGATSIISIADFDAVIGLSGINEDNLVLYRWAIESLNSGSELDQLKEIQQLVDSVNLEQISCQGEFYLANVSAGFYSSEVGWELTDSESDVLYEGTAPGSTIMCLKDGRYTLDMFDSYGDGWNDAVMVIRDISNEALSAHTLKTGSQGVSAVRVGDYSNQPPITNPSMFDLVAGSVIDISLSAEDPDGDNLTYILETLPSQGDFSDALLLTLQASIIDNTGALNVDLSSDGTSVFLAHGEGGLKIFDVNDSNDPKLVSEFKTNGSVYDVVLSNDESVIFVTDSNDGLVILDVSDLETPTVIGSLSLGANSRGITRSPTREIVYVATDNALLMISINDLQNPTLSGSFSAQESSYYVPRISSDGNTLFATSDNGFEIIDVTSSTYPTLIATLNSPGVWRQFEITDDESTAYVTRLFGIESIDLSDLSNPTVLDGVGIGGSWGLTLSSEGDLAYIGGSNMSVVDTSDPRSLTVKAQFTTTSSAYGLAFDESKNTAFITQSSGMEIVELRPVVFEAGEQVPRSLVYESFGESDGSDSFTFKVSDGRAFSNLASVILEIEPDSDGDGVGNNSDAFPFDSRYSVDSDSDGMPDAWEIQFGLDPNDPADAAMDADGDGVSNLEEFLAGTPPFGSIDVDGNGEYDALTDGLLLLRGMFGLTDEALISGTVGSNAIYTTSDDILAQIDLLGDLIDVDGNGSIDALTDGLVTLRYLFGLQGDPLIDGVIGSGASRTTAAEIEAHLDSISP